MATTPDTGAAEDASAAFTFELTTDPDTPGQILRLRGDTAPTPPAPPGPPGDSSDWLETLSATQVGAWYHHQPEALTVGDVATFWWGVLTDRALTDDGCNVARIALGTFQELVGAADDDEHKMRCGQEVGLATGEWFFVRAQNVVLYGSQPPADNASASGWQVVGPMTSLARMEVAGVLANVYASAVLADLSPAWRQSGYHNDHVAAAVVLAALEAADQAGVGVYAAEE